MVFDEIDCGAFPGRVAQGYRREVIPTGSSASGACAHPPAIWLPPWLMPTFHVGKHFGRCPTGSGRPQQLRPLNRRKAAKAQAAKGQSYPTARTGRPRGDLEAIPKLSQGLCPSPNQERREETGPVGGRGISFKSRYPFAEALLFPRPAPFAEKFVTSLAGVWSIKQG